MMAAVVEHMERAECRAKSEMGRARRVVCLDGGACRGGGGRGAAGAAVSHGYSMFRHNQCQGLIVELTVAMPSSPLCSLPSTLGSIPLLR